METKLQADLQYDSIHCFISGCFLFTPLIENQWVTCGISLRVSGQAFGIKTEMRSMFDLVHKSAALKAWWNYQYLPPSLTGILSSEHTLFTL